MNEDLLNITLNLGEITKQLEHINILLAKLDVTFKELVSELDVTLKKVVSELADK